MNEPKRRVIISSPSKHSVKKILKKMQGEKFMWAYFGEDVSRAISIEKMTGNKGQSLEISGMLQETAKLLRQPYIDYIGNLSLQKNSLEWWAGRLSEKNPYVSKTFLHACYIKVCIDILKEYPDEPLVLFVEKEAVGRSVIKNLPVGKLVKSFRELAHGALKDFKEFVLYRGWFLLNNLHRIVISKHVYNMQKRIKSREPLTLIHTFVDRRSFDEKGAYHESYFGKLPYYQRKSGKNIAIIPYIWGTVPYRKTIDNMAKSEQVFLVPHAFISVLDIFRVFFSTLVSKPKKATFAKFENMDISEIIHEDLKDDWVGMRMASDLLFYCLIKRLSRRRLSIDTVIYTYENHTWEKVLRVALQEFYPSAYLIGYQHSTFSMMHLNSFFSKRESNITPLPDRIVTSGQHDWDVFIQSGYPEELIVRGGAIRYAHLFESKMNVKRSKGGRPVVLVTPSISRFEALELIWKVFRAFGHRSEFKVVIKCHPMMPWEKISEDLKIRFPENFIISNMPISELLKESDALLYTGSTTCIEAMAAGVPAVHVKSDFSIDLDPLDFDPEARLSASNPEEIVKCVEATASMSEEELSKKRKMWDSVVKDLFGNVNDSVYRLFSR